MFAILHRQIPAQPGHIANRRRANIGSCSLTYASPYDKLGYSQQSKGVPESRHSTTVSGHPLISSSLTGHSECTKSILARSPSSASSSSSGSGSSGSSSLSKTVRWGKKDSSEKGRISPGEYSVPETIVAASLAIDGILKLLVFYVKDFSCPSELEFSLDGGSAMMLPNVDKNKSFIGQLCKLQKLAYKLDKTPTHGDAQLKVKHNKVSMSIGRALFRMKQVRIKFYVNFLDSVYDDLVTEINGYIKSFVYPWDLDFAENLKDNLVLLSNGKVKQFINQLRTLGSLRVQLGNIPEYNSQQLMGKREGIG
ncbi:hypothetical protein RSOL_165680 [Rhizoctonia solani AG-3 Rhs1AP]|uniref:Uncharacterized protein n=2 Tax=Rhizoctonia solani AG-3 TaxID=1086053 RepID=A0A074RIR2_9AGAM|nr:hypothetical protein RSOL_165680 [Rhizoctonia solani AG-3 Rhs1AP]KEP45240.1 hypothetical protein V565_298260 [Rhizoctonia solani 123E]